MTPREEIDQAFDALGWMMGHATEGRRPELCAQFRTAQALFTALPYGKNIQPLHKAVSAVKTLLDPEKIGDAGNRQTALQIINGMHAIAEGLCEIAQNRKPSRRFYAMLDLIETEREAARPELRAAIPATRVRPLRWLLDRLPSWRKAAPGAGLG